MLCPTPTLNIPISEGGSNYTYTTHPHNLSKFQVTNTEVAIEWHQIHEYGVFCAHFTIGSKEISVCVLVISACHVIVNEECQVLLLFVINTKDFHARCWDEQRFLDMLVALIHNTTKEFNITSTNNFPPSLYFSGVF